MNPLPGPESFREVQLSVGELYRWADAVGHRSRSSTPVLHIVPKSRKRLARTVPLVSPRDGTARNAASYGWKSKANITSVSVFAGSYFHYLRATNVASTKIG